MQKRHNQWYGRPKICTCTSTGDDACFVVWWRVCDHLSRRCRRAGCALANRDPAANCKKLLPDFEIRLITTKALTITACNSPSVLALLHVRNREISHTHNPHGVPASWLQSSAWKTQIVTQLPPSLCCCCLLTCCQLRTSWLQQNLWNPIGFFRWNLVSCSLDPEIVEFEVGNASGLALGLITISWNPATNILSFLGQVPKNLVVWFAVRTCAGLGEFGVSDGNSLRVR